MYNKIYTAIKTIGLIFILILLLKIVLDAKITTQIVLAPFLICTLASLGNNICNLFDKYQYKLIFQKIYIFSFFSYWFGFLLYFDFISFKNQEYYLILFSLLFWIVGIYLFKKILS